MSEYRYFHDVHDAMLYRFPVNCDPKSRCGHAIMTDMDDTWDACVVRMATCIAEGDTEIPESEALALIAAANGQPVEPVPAPTAAEAKLAQIREALDECHQSLCDGIDNKEAALWMGIQIEKIMNQTLDDYKSRKVRESQ